RNLLYLDLDVVGVRVAPAIGDAQIRAVLAWLVVGVFRGRLARVGRTVAELPGVLERRLAACGVRLELHRERRLPLLGVGIGPGQQRGRRLLGLACVLGGAEMVEARAVPTRGELRLLVVLAAFPDRSLAEPRRHFAGGPEALVDRLVAYYGDVSAGRLRIVPTIGGPVVTL